MQVARVGHGGDNSTHGYERALPSAGVLFLGQAFPWASARQCQSCLEQEREAAWPLLAPAQEPPSLAWREAGGRSPSTAGESMEGFSGEGERRTA